MAAFKEIATIPPDKDSTLFYNYKFYWNYIYKTTIFVIRKQYNLY